MKKIIEVDEECQSCTGTGLYVGMAERDGFAVVCSKCKGTGKFHFVHEYEEFVRKGERHNIKRVVQTNPGIMLGGTYDFGGMPYKEWLQDLPFPEKSEMRNYICPRWWNQCMDKCIEINWKNVCGDLNLWGRSFSECKNFNTKNKCWKKFDKEKGENK